MRFLLLALALAAGHFSYAVNADATLSALDKMLDKRSVYIDMRQQHIDSLVSHGNHNGFSTELLMEIADVYNAFNNDSALYYLRKGVEASSGDLNKQFRWKRAALLPLAGLNTLAMSEYDAISPDEIPDSLLASYYDSGRQMHSYIGAFFKDYPDIAAPHKAAALELQRKMLEALPHGSAAYRYNLGEYNILTGKVETARILLEEIVDTEPVTSNLRARAAYFLASIARDEGDTDGYISYLAMSAMSDLSAATREVVSLQELGNLMYRQGNVGSAYRYLSNALANAVECGAPLRMLESAQSLPIIEQAYNDQIDSWRSTIYWILAIVSGLSVVLIVTMFILHKEMRKMERLQASLKAANNAKEVYISQFLQLCSIYMDKLNQFCKIAARKLAAGQSTELYKMVKSGKFVDEQSRDFYEVFDNAFLHIYPNFFNDVNALLRSDQQIEKPAPGQLNTDLRILAFMRLGIEESSRIAQVLNYSLNTIYSYRNRLRARAIDRDNFEKNIMNISSSI